MDAGNLSIVCETGNLVGSSCSLLRIRESVGDVDVLPLFANESSTGLLDFQFVPHPGRIVGLLPLCGGAAVLGVFNLL